MEYFSDGGSIPPWSTKQRGNMAKKKPAKQKPMEPLIEITNKITHIAGTGKEILGSEKAFAALKECLEKHEGKFVYIDIWYGF